MPEVFAELHGIVDRLEAHYRDMQDIEFTIRRASSGCCRRARQAHRQGGAEDRRRHGGRRADHAARRRSCASSPARSTSCCTRRSIPTAEARRDRHRPARLARRGLRQDRVQRRRGRDAEGGTGDDGDPGAHRDHRPRTSTACTPPQGILTARGGMTSHAAVVARGMGRPCVSGAGAICASTTRRGTMTRVGGTTLKTGEVDHHRRLHRRGDARRGADHRSRSCPATSPR